MASADYSVGTKVTADVSNFEKGMNKAEKSLKGFSEKLANSIDRLGKKGLVGSIANVTLAMTGLTQSFNTVRKFAKDLGNAVNECTEAYKAQIIAERALDTAIQNNPFISGESSKALKQFASEMQKVSNYGDEQLIPMMTNLVSLGRTESEVMQIISVAMDMSAGMGISLDTAITQLNATLNGNIGRLGQQNAELKDLTEEELKQGKAIEILGEKFKGLSGATADTSKQLQNIKGDFKEALGEFTLPSSDVWNKFWSGFYERGTVVLKRINDSLQLKADYKATKAYVDSYAEAFKHMKPVERSAEWAKITAGLDDQNVKYMTEALQKQLQKQGGLKTLEREFLEALENEVLIRHEIEIEQEKAKKKTSENISDEEIINQLKEKYLKKIAEQETKWVNIEKVTKETVKTEEKLNFYQEQLVAIMTESGGMITENNQYYKDQIKIIDSLKKSLKGNEVQVEENTEKLSTFFSELKEGVEEYIDDIKNASNAWVKAFSDVSGIMQQSLQKVFEQLGKDLASGKTSWKNYARIAVDAVKEILIALAAQLTALTAVKIVTESYAEAAVAGAGAVAAGVAAGSLEVVSEKLGEEAKEVENVSKAATNAESNLSKLAKTTEDVKNVTQSLNQSIKDTLSAQNAVADFATTSKSIQSLITQQKTAIEAEKKTIEELTNKLKELEAQSSFDLLNLTTNVFGKANIKLELMRAQEAYDNATASLGKLNQQLVFQEINLRSSLREQISQLKQISNSYKIIYDKDRKSGGFLETATLDQTLSIVNKISSTFQSLSQYGMEIGESLVSNISMGISKADWKETLRDKVRTSLIELSVYTESFTTQLARISSQLVTQIITDNYDVTENIVKEYEKLYDTVEKKVENIDKVLDKAFGKKSSQTLTKFEEKIKSIKESFSDFGAELGDSFVNAINDGVSESSFLDTMKKWIRKNLIQTVVFTKSMQTEIEAIGQAISKGISEGFTDTSLHEIRRDLSWVFYNTNKTMSQIDTLLNGVFSGYATGTNNAMKGIALVGESGPELVRFNGGEQVLNTRNTQKALQETGGKTINQNITFNNLQDTSAFAMIQQLKQYNRQMAINGII